MPEANEVLQWRGQDAVDAEGQSVGTIDEIYLDAETDKPEWALIGSTFIPLAEASPSGNGVRFPYSAQQIRSAPDLGGGDEVGQDEEARLYAHYGLPYGETRSDSGLPEGGGTTTGDPTPTGSPGVVGNDVSGRETDQAMTRSEEELRVGKTTREAGRVRLRKHIVSEQVQTSVPVAREEVRVSREPITDANVGAATDGPAISEEEHEVVLQEEEVVVGKEAVPKERVRLDTETVTEERQVSEDVRKEQIDVVEGEGQPAEGIDGRRGTDEGV